MALLAVAVPAVAVFSGMDLNATLFNLRRELHQDYLLISQKQDQLKGQYESQHDKMVDIVKKCNDQSLMLYSQKQDYTFDISYALEKVTQEYNEFNKNRTPYDRIVSKLSIEINRYARLIESLRRLPPEMEIVDVIPDSLAYHNDTLDVHPSQLAQELEMQVSAIMSRNAAQDTVGAEVEPSFILNAEGREDRDSCLFYSSEMLKMLAQMRDLVMADSTYYVEAQLRMKESYDYAREYYKILQQSVFVEGQTPWLTIIKDPATYWQATKAATEEKYSSNFLQGISDYDELVDTHRDSRFNNSAGLFWFVFYLLSFFVLWGVAVLLMLPFYRLVKPIKENVTKEQFRLIALVLGCILFICFSNVATQDDMIEKAISLMHTFIWLLTAITTALLLRLKPNQLKSGFRNYLPTIFTALIVISCRVLFLPNALMNFVLPPLLLVMTLWQLFNNLRQNSTKEKADTAIGWISLGITALAMFISWAGYIFLALIILVWWYFLLTAILTIVSVGHLLRWYKENKLERRIAGHRKKITFVSGKAKEDLLFSATWCYDLVQEVLVPILIIASFPLCIRLALNMFEFNDLYRQIFVEPFIRHGGPDGFRMSLYNVLFLLALFFVFRYLIKAIRTVWQHARYRRFLQKYKRETVFNNEINLSLGNSIISVFIWFIYCCIVIYTLYIPTGSLGLVAGGLSAGIGLALKDIINNFIYGIQLMGGRLRVGDWIECDGVRGSVTDINYQSTQVETTAGTTVSFLNSALFAKSFTNLTKSNSYELLKLHVSVAYGTDMQRVRDVLVDAMQELCTKDPYGRKVVEPKKGVYVVLGEFGDSGVGVIVKQYVLASERIAYADRAMEVIYNALSANGITIPFPQRDLHIISDNVESGD